MPLRDIEISEDGKSLIISQEGEGEGEGSGDNDEGNKNEVNIEELLKVDTSALPEEQREAVEKLKGVIGSQTVQLGELRAKADLSEVLMQQLANQKTEPKKSGDGDGESEHADDAKKGIADGMKFEENDYYANHFKFLAEAIDGLKDQFGGLSTAVDTDKADGFKKEVTTFFKVNKVEPKVIHEMDKIAKDLGPKAYENLPRLLNLAKLELDIKDEPKETESKKTPNKKNVVDMGGKKKTVTEPKAIGSMKDAFNQAVEEAAG